MTCQPNEDKNNFFEQFLYDGKLAHPPERWASVFDLMARPRPISFEENCWIRAADADHFALLEDWQDVTKVTLYHKETGWSVELPPLHQREPRLQIYTDSHGDAFIIHGAHGSRHCRDYFPHQICMKDGDDEQTPWLRVLKRTQQTFSHCTLTDYKNTFKSGSLASRSALLPNRSTFRTAASARPKVVSQRTGTCRRSTSPSRSAVVAFPHSICTCGRGRQLQLVALRDLWTQIGCKRNEIDRLKNGIAF